MNWLKARNNLLIFLAYLLSSSFILRGIFGKGYLGLIYDWSYPFNLAKLANSALYLWSPLENGLVSKYKTGVVADLFLSTIRSPEFFKFLFIPLLALAGYSFYLLLRSKKFSLISSLLAGFFYLSSVIFITRLEAGYLNFTISYAFFPLLLLFYSKLLNNKKFLSLDLLPFSILLLIVFGQIHFAVFFFLVIIVDLFLSILTNRQTAVRKVFGIGLTICLYFILNLSWINQSISQAKSILNIGSFNNPAFLSRIDTLPHFLWNTLLLSDHGNTEEIFIAINSSAGRLAITFFFLAAIFFFAYRNWRRRKEFASILIISFLALLLSVGATAPFDKIYPTLYAHLPAVSLFRETYHLQYLLLFAYTLAFAMAFEQVENRLKRTQKRFVFLSHSLLCSISIILIVFFNLPALSGDLYGYFGVVKLPDLKELDSTIANFTTGRVFYPPNLNFWKLSLDKRIGVNYPDQIANSLGNSSVSQASSELDTITPVWKLRNAVVNDFMVKDRAFSNLLPYLGSNLIVDRKYLDSYYYASVGIEKKRLELRHRWMAESNEQKLKSWPDLKKTVLADNTDVYEVREGKDLVYLSTKPQEICNFDDVENSSDSFFYKPNLKVSDHLVDGCDNRIEEMLNKSENKLDFSNLPNLKHSADLGWSPGYLSFYESKLFSDTIDDFVFTRIPDDITFSLPGNGQLYLKYYSSPRSGRISLDGQVIETKSETEKWVFLSVEHDQDNTYTIESIDGENAIGGMGFVDLGKEQAKQEIQPLGQSPISWIKINPTEYQLNITEPTAGPKLIILSENYNPAWKLKVGNSVIDPILANTYANGYLISGDITGLGKIAFEGQSRYRALLAMEIIYIPVALGLYLVITIKRKIRG